MGRSVFAGILALALCAPAWAGNFKDNETLKPGEGILVTRVFCDSRINGVQIYQAGTDSSGGFWGAFKSEGALNCRAGVRTHNFPAGRYYVGMVYNGVENLSIAEDKAPHFTIEAGKLNYIGDLYAGQPMSPEMDAEAMAQVIGRMVSLINREPQTKQALQSERAALFARYPYAADAELAAVTPVSAPVATAGQASGVMQVSKKRWRRDADGVLRVCPRFYALPEGVKLAPDESPVCAGDYVLPEVMVQEDLGPSARVVAATLRDGEDGPLIVSFVGPPPTLPGERETVRSRISVPTGQWARTRHGIRVCYDHRTARPTAVNGVDCAATFVSTREFLSIQAGGGAQFIDSVTGGENGADLVINYDLVRWKR